MKEFSTRLIEWHDIDGRKNLPWQKKKTPYKVWISEIMLQQTQVSVVAPYFIKFIEKFPDIQKLADSNQDEILSIWSGLGYYVRARNIYKTAKKIKSDYKGKLPDSLTKLMQLPGIGKSTAGAILALGFKKKAAILDGNVKRVLIRHHKISLDPSLASTTKILWKIAEKLLPNNRNDTYTQSIMDLGARICIKSNPLCHLCPVKEDCLSLKEGLVEHLPIKRKLRPKPTKKVYWLIPLDPKGKMLLQKREDYGIWGGLWTFIESKDKVTLEKECLSRFKTENKHLKQLNEVKHSFSHYNLVATPYLVELNKNTKYKNTIWVNSKNVESLGVPAPVKKTIDQLTNL